MKEKETEGHRICQIAKEKGITQEDLKAKSGIHAHRLGYILAGNMSPNAEDRLRIAKVLSVEEVVIKNGLAWRFWLFLREKGKDYQFSRRWPRLALQGGLRGPDNLQNERFASERVQFEQLLLEDGEDQQESTSESPGHSHNRKPRQMRLI